MNVSLTTELEDFVTAKVDSGRYTSASEVVREALRLMEERDQARNALPITGTASGTRGEGGSGKNTSLPNGKRRLKTVDDRRRKVEV